MTGIAAGKAAEKIRTSLIPRPEPLTLVTAFWLGSDWPNGAGDARSSRLRSWAWRRAS
jgi:hypothetical protein